MHARKQRSWFKKAKLEESNMRQGQWVQEEEKLKNSRLENERVEDRLSRLLIGFDLKKSVL